MGANTANYCVAESFTFDGATAYYLGPIAYSVGGAINNLTGSGLVLEVNGESLAVPSAAGAVTFPFSMYTGQPYIAQIAQQPTTPVQTCTLSVTTGSVGASNLILPVNCVGAAGPPTGVTATAIAWGQVSVSWTPPSSNGGAQLTGYTITDNYGDSTTASATATSATIAVKPATSCGNAQVIQQYGAPCSGSDIIPQITAQSFAFTVTATNSFGSGAASAASNALTNPSFITNLTVTNESFNTCPNGQDVYSYCSWAFTFSPPANTGAGPLVDYVAANGVCPYLTFPESQSQPYDVSYSIYNCPGTSPVNLAESPLFFAQNTLGLFSLGETY
jgi:hypothetical protein